MQHAVGINQRGVRSEIGYRELIDEVGQGPRRIDAGLARRAEHHRREAGVNEAAR